MQKYKIAQIQAMLKQQQLDGCVALNPSHQIRDDILYYLLLQHLEFGLLYIPKQGTASLFTIPFEAPALKKAYPFLRVLPANKPIQELLTSAIGKHARVGYAADRFPSGVLDKLKRHTRTTFTPLLSIEKIGAIKTHDEIQRLAKAARITDKVYLQAIKHLRTAKTEYDVAQTIEEHMRILGVEPSFPTIVASGSNAAHPHHVPQKKKLQKGFCVIDMGVRLDGYCSDMTRTPYLGTPNRKDILLYETVLTAQRNAVARVQPGVSTAVIDAACRDDLGDQLSKQFIHSLGHGLGTQVHEWPRISSTADITLEEGMYITIEPGVYKQGSYGIRIEDDVLVTKKGRRVMNASPKIFVQI